MKKGIKDIDLLYGLSRGHDKGENQFDYGWFNHQTKGLKVVNTKALMKPFCNKVSLIAINSTI